MRLAVVYARLQVIELIRLPGFSIATLAFPSVFFLLFGLPVAHRDPTRFLAAYAGLAVLGVGFFQFGVSLAIERAAPWYTWVRTLPATTFSRIAGRTLAALVFTGASSGIVIATVAATTKTWPGDAALARLLATLLLGSIPFVAFGLVLAYWSSPKAALPVANLLYILLAYVGGLWSGPSDLPAAVGALSPYTPTRQWGDLLGDAVGGGWRPGVTDATRASGSGSYQTTRRSCSISAAVAARGFALLPARSTAAAASSGRSCSGTSSSRRRVGPARPASASTAAAGSSGAPIASPKRRTSSGTTRVFARRTSGRKIPFSVPCGKP
jgi:ABC-2 type transport system permease protein